MAHMESMAAHGIKKELVEVQTKEPMQVSVLKPFSTANLVFSAT